MLLLRVLTDVFLGLAEVVLDAIESASLSVSRRVVVTGVLVALLLLWVTAPRAMSVALPVVLLVVLAIAYVRDVAVARRLLRKTVFATGILPVAPRGVMTGRAKSVVALAQAFSAVRAGDLQTAESRLLDVYREDLGAWETRVLEASRALLASASASADRRRAGQLAPLGLPTGNVEVDRVLARAMVTSAWEDVNRLAAIQPALSSVGVALEDMAELCRLRRSDLTGGLEGEPPLSLDLAEKVAAEAAHMGDETLGRRVLSLAGRRGMFR